MTAPTTAKVRARSLTDVWADPDALKPPEAVIPRLAWRGRVTIMSAPDKGGKSTFVTAGAAAHTRGEAFLDGKRPAASGVVVWLKLEEHISDFAIRAKAFKMAGDRLAVFEVKPGLADLRREVRAWQADVVVVDVLIRWVGDRVTEGGAAYQWAPIMDELRGLARELNVAVVVLHHARRTDGKVRDSGEITANADVVIEQERLPRANVQKFKVRARFALSDFAVRLRGARYELVTAAATLAGAELGLDERVWTWLQKHAGARATQIRRGIGGKAALTDQAVERLVASGRALNRGTVNRPRYHAVKRRRT